MRHRNPFTIALWMLGVVFVAGGLASYGWAMPIFFQGTPDFEPELTLRRIATAMQSVSPGLILIGIATIIGLLFLRRWLRLRAEPSP